MKYAVMGVGLVMCAFMGRAQEPENGTRIQTLDELKRAVKQVMLERQVPGLGMAMVDERGPVWVEGLGLADVETGKPADGDYGHGLVHGCADR